MIDTKLRKAIILLLFMFCVTKTFICGHAIEESKKGVKNIFLIITCTLRADHLGCYGYDEPASPNLDMMAQNGVLLNNAISQAPFTLYSAASILTSKYPGDLFVYGIVQGIDRKIRKSSNVFARTDAVHIAKILKKHGYKTFCIFANPWFSFLDSFLQGYDDVYSVLDFRAQGKKEDVKGVKREKIDGKEVTDKVLAKIDEDGSQKRFFTMIYVDTHFPYMLSNFTGNKDMMEYDQAVSYLDSQIGRFLDGLKERDLLKESLIVFTSDHGEGLEKYHRYDTGHGHYLYNTTIKVPLIFYGCGIREGVRIDPAVPLLDIVPTILDLAGINIDGIDLEGESLKEILVGKQSSLSPREIIVSETDFPPRETRAVTQKRAVIYQGRFKYIKNYDWESPTFIDIFRSFFGWQKKSLYNEELYDLADDPNELNNLVEKRVDLTDRLSRVEDNINRSEEHIIPVVPVVKRGKDKARDIVRDQLRSLGYVH